MSVASAAVLHEVAVERERQDQKWGEQNWPDGTGSAAVLPGGVIEHIESVGELRRHFAQTTKNHCDQVTQTNALTYRHILDEEVMEAFAEDDPEKLRAELIQVAAVAVAWVEKIDRERK